MRRRRHGKRADGTELASGRHLIRGGVAASGRRRVRTMDIWYAHLDDERLMKSVRGTVAETKQVARAAKDHSKAARKDVRQQEKDAKLAARRAEQTPGRRLTPETACRRCRSWPNSPMACIGSSANHRSWCRCVTWPPRTASRPTRLTAIREQFRAYRATLQADRRHLLERFEVVDVARKVVGVGSVGTRAFIVLLQGRDEHDPLFLQVKEATASVLEAYLPRSRYRQHDERVVQGQRMMQAASDIYLGWTKVRT
jgi:hypothetical protein